MEIKYSTQWLGVKDTLKSRVMMAKASIPMRKIREPFKTFCNGKYTEEDNRAIKELLLCIKIDLEMLALFEEFAKTFPDRNTDRP